MTAEPLNVGRYPIVGLLATGGMAEILLAKAVGPSGFERPIVIKRVLPHLAREKAFIDMFLDEARIVANIRHPNVVQVHELGQDGDDLFMVMEFLEGESVLALMKRLRKNGRTLPHALAAHIAAEACAGLHAAHELVGPDGTSQNLVHRDVSPQNVFITYAGQVKVIDFGIAQVAQRLSKTSAGRMKGKFGYMAPEQCRGQPLDRRCDVFCLGIVLYELSIGKRLFKRPNDLLTLRAICQDPLPTPSSVLDSYPIELESIVMRSLMRSRRERFQSAAEMRSALVAAMRRLPLDDPPSDALSALMKELFERRIRKKAEVIRRMRTGSAITEVPTADAGDDGDMPDAVPTRMIDDYESHFDGPPQWDDQRGATAVQGTEQVRSGEDAPRSGPPKFLWVAIIGILIFVGGVAAWWIVGQDSAVPPVGEAPQTTATPVSSAVAAATSLAPVSTTTADPAAKTVTINIATEPQGATVHIGDEKMGKTPLELVLPSGDEPVTLVMARSGYQRLEEQIVPNANVRLQLSLRPARRYPGKPKSSGSKFRRFD